MPSEHNTFQRDVLGTSCVDEESDVILATFANRIRRHVISAWRIFGSAQEDNIGHNAENCATAVKNVDPAALD